MSGSAAGRAVQIYASLSTYVVARRGTGRRRSAAEAGSAAAAILRVVIQLRKTSGVRRRRRRRLDLCVVHGTVEAGPGTAGRTAVGLSSWGSAVMSQVRRTSSHRHCNRYCPPPRQTTTPTARHTRLSGRSYYYSPSVTDVSTRSFRGITTALSVAVHSIQATRLSLTMRSKYLCNMEWRARPP